ncbi:MAG: glycosyltransferase family 1 protein [Patescibacteria group bacterium]|jgi:glycosyltransferase involved in cell wall biosynthesis
MKDQPPYSICLDARFWRSETGGLGRYTRELIKHLAELDKTNHYTVLLTADDMPEWDIDQANFTPLVVPIIHYSLSEQTKFLQILNQHHFDLVHFLNFNHPIGYLRPFVTTIHDMTLFFFPGGQKKQKPVRRVAFRYIFKHASTKATKVIAISNYTKNDIQKYFHVKSDKIAVVYEGGPDPYKLPKNHLELAQNYLKTNQPYFLFVSQWRPHKGILTLVRAFEQFKRETKLPHRLVLLGSQKMATLEVLDAIKNSEFKADILAPGFAPDDVLASLYKNACAFVVPSEYEGFGLPVLEAYSYNTPVIVANNSSLPEVAGDAAIYFPTKDVAKLAEAMQKITQDHDLDKSLRAREIDQLAKFSWDKCAKETLDVYLSILSSK